MKVDSKPLLQKLRDRLANAQKDVEEIEHVIHIIETEGLQHPKEIHLFLNNTFSGLSRPCFYCMGHMDLDTEYWFNTEPQLSGDWLCDRCARKMAPYLTGALIPYIKAHSNFFDEIHSKYPSECNPLCESRVPKIMDFLHRMSKLKAFL